MTKITFANSGQPFYQSLKKSVDHYFTSQNIRKTGNWKLYIKTIVLIPIALFLYLFLLFGSYSALTGILLSFVLGFNLVSIAFNVMHDACHGSYSQKKWINELLSLTMNALGSNAFIWKIKHNILHHTYTNVDGLDDDIAKTPVLRHCPTQKHLPLHKYQHIYMFVIYALSTLLWVFLTDMLKYFSRKIVVTEMKISLKEHIIFWVSKALYVFFYIALPIMLVGVGPWLAGYLIVNLTMGLTIAIVFQLAHVVEKTSFEDTGTGDRKVIGDEWAVHEIKTTSNFAQNNKWLSWFAGGLNFQIEHHLFPRISHIHYPAISAIVQEECRKSGLPYHTYPLMQDAVKSHIRLMKALGTNPDFKGSQR